MATPIFVLGKGRSGTTWLATQLCDHPRIAGVLIDGTRGIKESRYFSDVYGRYGDLSEPTNFIEFAEIMSATDYFKLAGATEELLYRSPAKTYEDVFRRVMDAYADAQGADHWIEKTPGHTRKLEDFAAYYPDAKFVGVIRNLQPVVASTVEFHKREITSVFWPKSRQLGIIVAVSEWVYYNKIMRTFARRSNRILLVRYEDMVAEQEKTLREICEFIGIEYDARILDASFRPNTSFRDERQRKQALNGMERGLVRFWAFFLGLVPLRGFRAMDSLIITLKGRRILSPSHFRLLFRSKVTLADRVRRSEPVQSGV